MSLGLAIFISVWSTTAVLAAAFQCQPPDVWDSIGEKCYNRVRALEPLFPIPLIHP